MDGEELEILPREEMLTLVKTHMHYDEICRQLQQKAIRGSVALLDRMVRMIAGVQYETGTVQIQGAATRVEEVAQVVLQLQQHEVEYLMGKLRGRGLTMPDAELLEAMYFAVDAPGSWAYAQRRGLKLSY